MLPRLIRTAMEYKEREFADFINAVLFELSESDVNTVIVVIKDLTLDATYRTETIRPRDLRPKEGGYYFDIKLPIHIWHSMFLNATFNIEKDIFTDGECVHIDAHVKSLQEINMESVSINTVVKPKVIDTTKPIPTDDVRQLIDAAMDRDDKEIYIYISKDATTITISPKRDELTTCKETLCENAHKVMAQEHFEKLIREFVFRDKKGE